MFSALHRQTRSGDLDARAVPAIEAKFRSILVKCDEVPASLPVRVAANLVLVRHELKAADALQLAAAIVAVRGRPRGQLFVTADGALARAAKAEGLKVVIPAAG